jgi:hypothetical protein
MSSIQSTNLISQLASSLLRQHDTNKDNSLSMEEFSGLVAKLLAQAAVSAGAGGALPAGATGGSSLPASAASSIGAGAGLPFEGFNFQRAQNPNESAKDAFAMLARQSGTLPRTRVEAEQWFNSHIKGQMDALGHRINWVQGDKFSFTNHQGTFTVDFVRGADGPDPAFAWQWEQTG